MMKNSISRAWLAAAWLLATLAPARAGVQGYLMYPHHDGERVVFSAEGDLWTAPLAGGRASRLTTGRGDERLAKFSPDGQALAFTASYGGNDDVYVMPADGGPPKRLTYGNSREEVVGWSADGTKVLFRSRMPPTMRTEALLWVSAEGGAPERLDIGKAALASIHADGRTVAFNRTGRFNRDWKRYGGGRNSDVWIGDLQDKAFFQATEFEGENAFPMWSGDRLFFVSDRDGRMNLWSLDKAGKDLKQHTFHEVGDVRWPDIAKGVIVYHHMGDLWTYDIAADAGAKLDIDLPSDRPLARERWADAMDYVEEIALSDDGERLAFATRGNIYAAKPKRGRAIAIAGDSAARVKNPAWSPDGDWIAAWSTATGEEELWAFPSDGWGDPEQITKDSSDWHFEPAWSPDGTKIAWADSLMRLRYFDLETDEIVDVDDSPTWEITEYAWSPDSRFLAYSFTLPAAINAIRVRDTLTGENHQLTSDLYSSHGPAWSPDGQYLFFLSNRVIRPMFGDLDMETITTETMRPYFLILAADGDSFLTPPELLPDEDDEAVADDDSEDDEDKDSDAEDDDSDDSEGDDSDEDSDGAGDDDEIVEVLIDFEGIEDRAYALPVEAGNFSGLSVAEKRVFYLASPTWRMGEDDDLFEEDDSPESTIMAFKYGAKDFDDREGSAWLDGVSGFSMSGDGSTLLVDAGGDYSLVSAEQDSCDEDDLEKGSVDASRLSLRVDARAEWAQILRDAYLYQRQFFYAPNMGGVDWDAAYERAASLLPRIATRTELNDLIGEMIGELGTSHTYVWGGGDLDRERGDHVSIGSLGADFAWDEAAGAWKIEKIYRGYSWSGQTSPLLAPHARLKEGDYLHAIDGRELDANTTPEQFLLDAAGKVVELAVSEDGDADALYAVSVEAMGSDQHLRYIDWVEGNRARVSEASDGEFGYLHIPDMSSLGMIMFNRYFYPQIRKKALVVDARYNGGGWVSQLIVARLSREVVAYGTARNATDEYTYPDKAFEGPIVVLTNEEAGSDGDIFPYVVQLKKLGPVIGTRTWGGVVGIRGDKGFVDSGMTTQPEFAWWDTRRGWGLENEGVYPDIVLDITPEDEIAGRDPQLERAIAELKAELERNDYSRPQRPPYPNTLENWKRRSAPYLKKP